VKAFLGAFDVLPGFLWALLLASALAFGGVKVVQVHAARQAIAEARLDLANYKAAAAESARLAERAERQEEARRNSEQRKALDEAANENRTARADLAIARSAGDRLRQQIAKYADAARQARDRASTLDRSAATGDPIGVLADVLGRCSKRVEILAGYADASRIAGTLCERSYGALTP
jgi:hypothetical protein